MYNRDTVEPDGDGNIRFTFELLPPGTHSFLVVQRTGEDRTPFTSWLFFVTVAELPDTFGIDDDLRSELNGWLESEGLIEPE